MHSLRCDVGAELPQGLDVVEHPESASVCGEDQRVLVHEHVVDRDDGKLLLQRLPVGSVVERKVYSALRARKQQTRVHVILGDRVGGSARG